MSANNGSTIPSVQSPMGERRPMIGEAGPPLSPGAPTPQMAYPQVPGPVQPTMPQTTSASQLPVQTTAVQSVQPIQIDAVPPSHAAMILDGLRQQVTIAQIQAHLPGLTEHAIRTFAAQYNQPIWDGQQWTPAFQLPQAQAPVGAGPLLQPPQQMGALWGSGVGQQPASPPVTQAAPVASVASAPKVSTRLSKADYEPIEKLHAQGMDVSTIAQTLGKSPDTVMRALKNIAKEREKAAASTAPAPEQPKQPELPHTQAPAPAPDPLAPPCLFKVGDFIEGQKDVPPQELQLLVAHGLAVDWIGTKWLVVPLEQMMRAQNPQFTPAPVPASSTMTVRENGDLDFVEGSTNPVGSYLQLVLDKVNHKLERYGLCASFKLEIAK